MIYLDRLNLGLDVSIKRLVLTVLLLVADNSCEYPERGYDCDGNINEPYVGMHAFGGIIFKLNKAGDSGFVTTLKILIILIGLVLRLFVSLMEEQIMKVGFYLH